MYGFIGLLTAVMKIGRHRWLLGSPLRGDAALVSDYIARRMRHMHPRSIHADLIMLVFASMHFNTACVLRFTVRHLYTHTNRTKTQIPRSG